MNPSALPAFLQIISAAVTPVVMLSACSTLILGLNAKHSGLSDRIRAAAAEIRSEGISQSRRRQLLTQIALFRRRFAFVWIAVCLLYAAVMVYILTTLAIVLEQNRNQMSGALPISLFMLGVGLMFAASGLELVEVSLASRTMEVELEDILGSPGKGGGPGDIRS